MPELYRQPPLPTNKAGRLLLAVLILGLAYGLMVTSAVRKSATVDEQSHLFRGVAYLKTGATHFLLGHPLLGSTLSALPLLTEPDLRLPVADPAWAAGNWSLAGDAFLWRLNDRPLRLLFLGRLPVIWLTLMLGALVLRWAREWAGWWAGLLAASVCLFDPNVLAHGRFVTSDMPVVLFFTLAVYGFWRWQRWGSWEAVVIMGVGVGLAGAAKFSAALLWPILGGMALVLAWQRRDGRPFLALLGAGVVGTVALWAVYGFSIRPLAAGIPFAGAFWDDLFWVLSYFDKPHGAYLAGAYSATGWWYYFLVAFLLKTPLPTLLLLGLALIRWGWQRSSPRRQQVTLFLVFPAFFYLGVSLLTSLNIGYRHLLPMLPFLSIFMAVVLVYLPNTRRIRQLALLWLVGISLWVWPNYVPFFNLLAGGQGWQILSDSNVDWGQDLPQLAAWQAAQRTQGGDSPLYLSYFGTASPRAYGLDVVSIPTWPPAPEQVAPTRQVFNPLHPAPGWYAISVTNLHGVVLGQERAQLDYFRQATPITRIGGSIFIYEVPAQGETADVAFSHTRPALVAPLLQEVIPTNDVRVRWLDATTSFIWPAHGGWLVADLPAPVPALAAFWPQPTVVSGTQSVFVLPPPPAAGTWAGPVVTLAETVTFLGAQEVALSASEVVLLTAWRVERPLTQPLQIFVHALNGAGMIVGQWDGLDSDPVSWLPGDVYVQFHRFSVTEKPVHLATGWYDKNSLIRLGEQILLEAVSTD